MRQPSTNPEQPMSHGHSDRMGILLSIICCIHCVATPLLLGLLPTLSVWIEEEWVHLSFFAVVLPVGLFAFWQGRKKHGTNLPIILGSIGLTVVALAMLLPHQFGIGDHSFERKLSIFGGIVLIVSHALNMYRTKCTVCPTEHHHHHVD